MDAIGYIMMLITILAAGEAMWIWRLTKNYHWVQEELSRAGAKVAQHKILIADLQMLIEDDADLDRCLQEEIDGKAYARARDVEYEQNKVAWDDAPGPDRIPWVPIKNPK